MKVALKKKPLKSLSLANKTVPKGLTPAIGGAGKSAFDDFTSTGGSCCTWSDPTV
ncbi:hypothetical protein [Pseudoalteromonas umbrosa]|uniref:hypothetical protein n=1 Tax=Pseudoalteromonas umbrosa TaxID=3048489 RepID=UPI0024C46A55|nr:hypothetical protein [Pseudoalteromonas sp. B95]MDK1286638.1 hypothetical protein [Pseudoalteromonas sp. B95]